MFDILLSFFIILTNNFLSNTQTIPFDNIVSFGDDNTDTGNVYSLTDHQWPLVPPYYLGRFTNGPLWIEKLNISTIINYAYIGATIDNDNLVAGFTQPNRTLVPGVRQQIVLYLANNDITKIDLSRTLYVIWAGANDYLDNSSLTPTVVVASLIDAVYDLVGVEITNILVINQPPLQSYPFFSQSKEDINLHKRIIDHNTYLSANILQIQENYNQTSIKVFDLYSLITNILSNNSTSKLNTINNCWTILNNNTVLQCSNASDYVFIDDYHLTTSVHQSIADNIHSFLLASSSSCHFPFSKLSIFIYVIVYIINIKENE